MAERDRLLAQIKGSEEEREAARAEIERLERERETAAAARAHQIIAVPQARPKAQTPNRGRIRYFDARP